MALWIGALGDAGAPFGCGCCCCTQACCQDELACHSRLILHMCGASVLHLVSAQPKVPRVALTSISLALATAQNSLVNLRRSRGRACIRTCSGAGHVGVRDLLTKHTGAFSTRGCYLTVGASAGGARQV